MQSPLQVGRGSSLEPSPGITAKPLMSPVQFLSVAHRLGPTFFYSLISGGTGLTVSCSKCENSPTGVYTLCGPLCASSAAHDCT